MHNIKLKPDWEEYLHNIRKKEIALLKNVLETGFDNILEIGAGDGYQSRLLADYCSELHCTELNEHRLRQLPNPKIHYKICDAEKIDQYYSSNMFDLVFSSNVFEHLPNPSDALKGIKKILKNEGLLINIMPNPLFDATIIAFHYPNYILKKLEVLINKLFVNSTSTEKHYSKDNNLKVKKNISIISKLLHFPQPHGIHNSFREEIVHFSKKNWLQLFKDEDFETIEVIKGPFYSGYGFGLKSITKLFERFGISSENIYVLKKKKVS